MRACLLCAKLLVSSEQGQLRRNTAIAESEATSQNIGGWKTKLKVLVGSGDRIMLLALPFLVIRV